MRDGDQVSLIPVPRYEVGGLGSSWLSYDSLPGKEVGGIESRLFMLSISLIPLPSKGSGGSVLLSSFFYRSCSNVGGGICVLFYLLDWIV